MGGPFWVAVAGGGERHHQDVAIDFGDRQSVGGWFGGVDNGSANPDFADVLDAQAWVLEQVCGLSGDLERSSSSSRSRSNNSSATGPIVMQTDTIPRSWGLCSAAAKFRFGPLPFDAEDVMSSGGLG